MDKIKEVMELVREMGDADFYAGHACGTLDDAKHDKDALKASSIEVAIESKLRALLAEQAKKAGEA